MATVPGTAPAGPGAVSTVIASGRTATVAKVVHDVDGHDHLAVLLDDDPGQDLALVQGRFLYFAPDEVEPIGAAR